jgi:hypothetical protein
VTIMLRVVALRFSFSISASKFSTCRDAYAICCSPSLAVGILAVSTGLITRCMAVEFVAPDRLFVLLLRCELQFCWSVMLSPTSTVMDSKPSIAVRSVCWLPTAVLGTRSEVGSSVELHWLPVRLMGSGGHPAPSTMRFFDIRRIPLVVQQKALSVGDNSRLGRGPSERTSGGR